MSWVESGRLECGRVSGEDRIMVQILLQFTQKSCSSALNVSISLVIFCVVGYIQLWPTWCGTCWLLGNEPGRQRRGCGLEGRGSGRNGVEGERACGVRGIIIGRGGEGGERGKVREMEEKMKPTIIIISTM